MRVLRITLVDWLSALIAGYDFYVPHRNVESMLVCTEDHDDSTFGDHAGPWQVKMNYPDDWKERLARVSRGETPDGEQP